MLTLNTSLPYCCFPLTRLHPCCLHYIMSEKFKELVEVPQEFVKDGKQVRMLSLDRVLDLTEHPVFSSWSAAQSHHKRVSHDSLTCVVLALKQ